MKNTPIELIPNTEDVKYVDPNYNGEKPTGYTLEDMEFENQSIREYLVALDFGQFLPNVELQFTNKQSTITEYSNYLIKQYNELIQLEAIDDTFVLTSDSMKSLKFAIKDAIQLLKNYKKEVDEFQNIIELNMLTTKITNNLITTQYAS